MHDLSFCLLQITYIAVWTSSTKYAQLKNIQTYMCRAWIKFEYITMTTNNLALIIQSNSIGKCVLNRKLNVLDGILYVELSLSHTHTQKFICKTHHISHRWSIHGNNAIEFGTWKFIHWAFIGIVLFVIFSRANP